jgi:hypothetical protein
MLYGKRFIIMVTSDRRVCERGTRCLHAREHRRVAIFRQNGTIVSDRNAITINDNDVRARPRRDHVRRMAL